MVIETIKKLRPVTYDWTNDFADSQTMYIMGRDENGGTVAKKKMDMILIGKMGSMDLSHRNMKLCFLKM